MTTDPDRPNPIGVSYDLWLVSYPKSGNTWLRFVVFYLSCGRSPRNSRELDHLINSRLPAMRSAGPVIKKSHATRDMLARELRSDSRVIYIRRHPLDVMQSAFHYGVLTGELENRDHPGRDAWIARYLEHAGNPLWTTPKIPAGDWGRNVEGWSEGGPWRQLDLSYEGSVRDPRKLVEAIAEFLDLGLAGPEIDACLSATSFETLRAFEEDEIARAVREGATQGRFTYARRFERVMAGERFFRSGRAGAYLETFTHDEIERAWDVFGPAAERVGYSLSVPDDRQAPGVARA